MDPTQRARDREGHGESERSEASAGPSQRHSHGESERSEASAGPSHVDGLVLCHAQGDRLAFPASEVDAFDHATPDMPYAGAGFVPGSKAPEGAKALRCGASALTVDRLEIHALPTPRLPVPDALAHAWGGALLCFVECAGELWPVVSLRRLSVQPEVSS